ncbi:MAG: flagellar filament capping protein FliD [Acidimicrobiales bacterium]
MSTTPARLTLSTIAEGSDNTIEVTGGSAAAELGWNLTEGVATGTDGIVTVDGVANTITDTTKDTAVTLNASAGSIAAVMSGPMRLGTANTEQVSFGSGTLSEVVSAINNADGLNYGAVAVNTGSGYRLQLTANETGAAATVGIDQSMFTGLSGTPGVDMFKQLTAAQDAEITFEGVNPYSITSASNTFKDIMPGVSATVSAVTTTPVTISSTKDTEKVADAVESLVNDLSTLFARIKQGTKSDVEAGTTGLLAGSSAPRRAQNELQRALLDPVAGNSIISGGAAGITLESDGTIKFDRAAFISAYEADPEGMQRLFVAPDDEVDSTPGILDRISEVAKNASSFGTGYLATAKEAKDNQVNTFNRQVDAYEVRLERRQAALQRQYAALEVALGSLNNQSAWLVGQLGSLSTNSG